MLPALVLLTAIGCIDLAALGVAVGALTWFVAHGWLGVVGVLFAAPVVLWAAAITSVWATRPVIAWLAADRRTGARTATAVRRDLVHTRNPALVRSVAWARHRPVT